MLGASLNVRTTGVIAARAMAGAVVTRTPAGAREAPGELDRVVGAAAVHDPDAARPGQPLERARDVGRLVEREDDGSDRREVHGGRRRNTNPGGSPFRAHRPFASLVARPT